MTGAGPPSPVIDVTEIGRRWLEACANAEVQPGTEAHVAVIPGHPPNKVNFAMYYDPGSTIYSDERFPLTKGQRDFFNGPELRDTHRISVFTQVEPRVLSGLFRHELQHARQFRSRPDAYRLTSLTNDALSIAYGPRPGGGVLYNATPLEQEANAAASRFLRSLDGEPTPAELEGPQSQIFGQVDLPWGEDELPAETLACLALHPDEVEQLVAQRRGDLAMLIAPLHPSAAELWQRLRHDTELQTMRASFQTLVPTDEKIVAAGGRPGDAWRALSEVIVAARDRARAVISDAY